MGDEKPQVEYGRDQKLYRTNPDGSIEQVERGTYVVIPDRRDEWTAAYQKIAQSRRRASGETSPRQD